MNAEVHGAYEASLKDLQCFVQIANVLLCRNPVDRILSAYEFVVEVASRQVLKLKPGKKVRHLFWRRNHAVFTISTFITPVFYSSSALAFKHCQG